MFNDMEFTTPKANQWVDVHAHFAPPETPEQWDARWQVMRDAKFMVPHDFKWT